MARVGWRYIPPGRRRSGERAEVQMGPRVRTPLADAFSPMSHDSARAVNATTPRKTSPTASFVSPGRPRLPRPYSEKLLQAWDKYAKTGELRDEKPDNASRRQLYIDRACDDGGTALEHFDIRSMKEKPAPCSSKSRGRPLESPKRRRSLKHEICTGVTS